MKIERDLLKAVIKKNPEGHEKLTGRYYLSANGIVFVNGDQPKPQGALRIPSFGDNHPYRNHKYGSDRLADLLAADFLKSLER